MATVLCRDDCLWITDIGCGYTRRVLLGMEPGSRIWLSIDERPQLFERMHDDAEGRSVRAMRPVDGQGTGWANARRGSFAALDLEVIERPADTGAAALRYGIERQMHDLKDPGHA